MQIHVGKCPGELASAFTYILAETCGSEPPDGMPVFENGIQDFAWTSARFPPSNRDRSENIVWLWTYTLMLISIDPDVSCLREVDRQLSKRTVFKMANDLGHYLLTITSRDGVGEISDGIESTQKTIQRTCLCIYTVGQLHAIGAGKEDLISSTNLETLPLSADCTALVSGPTAFLASK